jgi:phage terminase Nu1 subunit (DNA packaging protein)
LGIYIEHLRAVASRSGGRPSADGDDLKAERLRLTRAQADKEETRVARERGELVPAEAVSREWASILRDLRNALLAVPSRCAATLPHLTATDSAYFEREIRKALEGAAHEK